MGGDFVTWSEYRKECKATNVEPTKADFLGIEHSWEQIEAQLRRAELKRQRRQQPKTMAASA